MISSERILRALDHERFRLKTDELDTPFVKGIIQGITLSMAIVKIVHHENKHQRCNNPTGFRRTV